MTPSDRSLERLIALLVLCSIGAVGAAIVNHVWSMPAFIITSWLLFSFETVILAAIISVFVYQPQHGEER